MTIDTAPAELRIGEPAPDIELTDEQQEAREVLGMHLSPVPAASPFAILEGYAGTGKTTTLGQTVRSLKSSRRIWMTAPTHKAVKVLRRTMRGYGIAPAQFCTVHSALSLRLKRAQGVDRLVASGRPPKVRNGDALVVDEASMVNLELLGHIRSLVRTMPEVRVVFVGDPAQLPPVSEAHSDSFATARALRLNRVMRQRSENPVLGLCTDIRHAIERGESLPAIHAGEAQGGTLGVHVMTGSLWSHWMPDAFRIGEGFDEEPDRFRVIAWTNATVNSVNARIQRLRYPMLPDGQPFALGEPVVMGGPIKSTAMPFGAGFAGMVDEDDIVIQNQTEGRVTKIRIEKHPVHENIAAWLVSLELEDGMDAEVFALDKHMRETYEETLANQRRVAIAFIRDGERDKAREAWRDFYGLQESFADVRCAYAMTAHKSQGSTFENVFVDVHDIMKNPNQIEALRCLYVACSRASDNVIVNSAGGV